MEKMSPDQNSLHVKKDELSGEKIIQEKFGTEKKASKFYEEQMLDHLNQPMIDFISKQEIAFISTSDQEGNCDTSFRGGEPNFIKVLDEKTILYPEYKGNGIQASLGNIYENPHISILLIDFFQSQIGLHVNGGAEILESDNLCSRTGISEEEKNQFIQQEGRKLKCWVKITVDEAYIHCSKHIPHLAKVEGKNENKAYGNFFKTFGK